MASEKSLYLVDTSAWVWALRRNPVKKIKDRIDVLLGADELATTGLVKCEIFADAISEIEYKELKHLLDALHYFETTEAYWEQASRLGFQLRRKGVTITTYDLLIATIAEQNQSILLHADKHFDQIVDNWPSLQVESYVKALPKKQA